jgi:mRNA interferase MazF
MVVRKGEVWWASLPQPAGRRPVVVLSRDDANRVRDRVIVAPVTTRIRGVPSEVSLGREDGLPKECVANVDTVTTIPKRDLAERISLLAARKVMELERALRFVFALR